MPNVKYFFTPEMIEEFKQLYPVTLAADLAKRYNCSVYKIYNLQEQTGIVKDKQWIAERARMRTNNPEHASQKYRYKKGREPENKGKKQTEYMSPEAIARTVPTRFKKGNIPQNHKPVGSERIDRDGYIWVKTAEPALYELKHRVVWRQHFGEIPRGHNIQFKDGNRQNFDINNLYMISRAQQLKYENSYLARYPDEIIEVIKTKAVLNRTITILNKKNNENKE